MRDERKPRSTSRFNEAAERAAAAAGRLRAPRPGWSPRKKAALAGFLLLGCLGWGSFRKVPPGHRGVVIRLGHVTGESFDEGLHLKLPVLDQVDLMSVQIQKFSAPDMQASSKDLQTVQTSCAVNYRLEPTKVTLIRQEIGLGKGVHESTALQPQLQESIKAVTAKYNAQDLIAKRALVSQEMRQTFQAKLDHLVQGGFVVDEFAITDFQFSDTFARAIEAKVEANERALQAENEVRQAKAEAEKKVATARGEAESVRIQAQAEAAPAWTPGTPVLGSWGVRLVSTVTNAQPPRAILGLPSGEEVEV